MKKQAYYEHNFTMCIDYGSTLIEEFNRFVTLLAALKNKKQADVK